MTPANTCVQDAMSQCWLNGLLGILTFALSAAQQCHTAHVLQIWYECCWSFDIHIVLQSKGPTKDFTRQSWTCRRQMKTSAVQRWHVTLSWCSCCESRVRMCTFSLHTPHWTDQMVAISPDSQDLNCSKPALWQCQDIGQHPLMNLTCVLLHAPLKAHGNLSLMDHVHTQT